MSIVDFREHFYGKYEELHKRFLLKYSAFDNLIEIFSKLQNALKEFSKSINVVDDNLG